MTPTPAAVTVVTHATAGNVAASGGGSVTVLGFTFGYADRSPTAFAGGLCATASWASATSVACRVAGGGNDVSVVVGDSHGGLEGAFSYDGALRCTL